MKPELTSLIGSIFNGIGVAVGLLVYYLESKRRHLNTDGMAKVAIIGIVSGILAARLIERIAEGGSIDSIANPMVGGRTILGAVIGGWIAVELAKRKMGIRVSTGPLWAVAMPTGEFFGRIGCYFNGCCFGKTCSLPWAIYQHGEMRHPTQLYLAGSSLAIFGITWALRDHPKVFAIYMTLWAGSRFVIEFFRDSDKAWGGLSLAQVACLAIVYVFGVRFVRPKSVEARA